MKKARVVFSTLFFIAVVYIFYFSGSALGKVIIEATQFGTAVSAWSIPGTGIVFAVVLSILAGRVYCSFICPMGYIQDIAFFISKRVFRRKKSYRQTNKLLKYITLLISIFLLLAGINVLYNLLEPFSIFGRIVTNFSKPVIGNIVNITHEIHSVSAVVFGVAVGYLFFFLVSSFFAGRFYCNNFCPVGTILGLVSNFSITGLTISKDKCVMCGKCETMCKGGCIDSKNKKIYNENCVRCFNCLNCSTQAIQFGKRKETKIDNEDINKREFLKSAGISLGVLTGITSSKLAQASITKENKYDKGPIIPPGSGTLKNFREKCTGCGLCISKCPANIIKPSLMEFGVAGFMQPYISYDSGFCQYECNECTKACPTGAISELKLSSKKKTQIGKVNLKKELCIVYKEKRDCGACSEHCPTKAVRMVEFEGNYRAPETDTDICIGCGACEYICPVRPNKAIVVTPNTEHILIKEKKKEEARKIEISDFPF